MSIRAGIAYEDWVQGGTKNITAAAGNIGVFDHLKTPQLSECVGASSATPSFPNVVGASGFFSWGDARPVDVVSILDVRSEGDLFFDLYGLGPGGGPFTTEHRYQGFPSSDFVRHLHILFPEPRMMTGVGLNFGVRGTANGGTGLGSFTIGRLWAGPMWRVPEGIKRAWRSGILDPGEKSRSPGGQNYPAPEQRRRWVKMSFSHVEFEQAYGREDNTVMDLQQLQMRTGTTTPVIVFPRLQEHAMHRVGIYGTASEWDAIENVAGDYFTSGLRVEEDL